MRIFKFISLFYWLKSHFNYLPKGFQDELIQDLEDYKELCIISKSQNLMKGV